MERDIVERLRDPTYAGPMQHLRSWSEIDQICNSAADLIESLRSELDEARKALEPFAAEAAKWVTLHSDDLIPNLTPSVVEACDRELAAFSVGDMRRASAIRQKGESDA